MGRGAGWSLLLVIGLGCVAADEGDAGEGSTSEGETYPQMGMVTSFTTMPTTTIAGSTGEGGDTTGAEDTTTGMPASEACTDCVAEACASELSACVADAVCVCWLGCAQAEDEVACQAVCGETSAPEPWAPLDACYAASTLLGGECTSSCLGPCEACIVSACGEAVTACQSLEACRCWQTCTDAGNGDCASSCGDEPTEWASQVECVVDAAAQACRSACE